MDNRIGIWGDPIQWPEFTVTGLPYMRPCTTLGLDTIHFVVLDLFPSTKQTGEIEKLRQQIRDMGAPPMRAGKRTDES